ncbi:MAG: hypothetical protein QOI10_4413 [Solirubrobacterales bacterium]|jgi:hypothetical protein|nr:hypothetical protein [Solirubrobacterales bacterium]
MSGDGDLTRQLRDLAAQHRDGMISDQEYAAEKCRLLGGVEQIGAQETVALPATTPQDAERVPSREPHRSLVALVAAVVVVISLLALAIWLRFGLLLVGHR